jgi:hypothetical protein
MTMRQRLATKRTAAERRAFEAASTILDASGLRYQSSQIDGLAQILMAFAEHEIHLTRCDDSGGSIRETTR